MNIPFTDNYEDLSTDTGYQFKFICQRCGNGYMSSFKKSTGGMLSGALNVVGNLFGGAAQRAAYTSDDVQRMTAGPAHDKALQEAVGEIRPLFIQCSRCGTWVCKQVCWNEDKGLCKQCAPKTEEEVAAMQQETRLDQVKEKMKTEDFTKDVNITSENVVRCPHCNTQVKGGKFCSKCGGKLSPDSHCTNCGAKMASGAKFCPECGQKTS